MKTIQLDNICLRLPVSTPQLNYFKKTLLNNILIKRFSLNQGQLYVQALTNVNLSFVQGDRVALIGPNGSGKTTLLRVISGIISPTEGTMKVNGRVSPILSTGIGIQETATGYENIKLILLQMGLNEISIKKIVPDVIEFCDLGDFIHMPFNTYSSGMKTRIMFGTLTGFRPEIVAMDEVISTGDLFFQEKAIARFDKFIKNIKLIITATHDLDWVEKNCNKAVLIIDGKVVKVGVPNVVIDFFKNYKS